MNWSWDWGFDGWIILAGSLCAISCALSGSFLVLRRMSLLGDAITHAVLPGLAAAFLLSGTRTSWVMFAGAVLVGVLTAVLTEWVHRLGRVDEGASLGVVFTTLFALGLVMIVRAADTVDLDPSCVLYGAIETVPLEMWSIAGVEVPRVAVVLAGVTLLNLAFVIIFFKELKISSFDATFATVCGYSSRFLHYALMTIVAVTAVASFESVGNILVVAMFVVPAAAAHLLTDRLSLLLMFAAAIGVASACLGHWAALAIPRWFGHPESTTTAGMMAVVAGLLFLVTALLAPRYGVLTRLVRGWKLRGQILSEDVLGLLFRLEERDPHTVVRARLIRQALFSGRLSTRLALWWQRRKGRLIFGEFGYRLTDAGKSIARGVVRSHRLWEQYLIDHVGVSADRIHDQAERLEHFTDRQMRDQLERETASPDVDPHGSPIPQEFAEPHNGEQPTSPSP